MTVSRFRLLLGVAGLLAASFTVLPAAGRAADLPALWKERIKSIVAVEFFTETETDRRPSVVFGLVADDAGHIALPASVFSPRVTPAQLKDFRVYRPGEPVSTYYHAEFLGEDPWSGWNFLRVEEKMRPLLKPITAFAGPGAPPDPALGEEFWGIGMRAKEEDFLPYLLMAKVGVIQSMPERSAIALAEVASPGLPVFSQDGSFAGVAVGGYGSSYVEFSRTQRGVPIMLMNIEESRVFTLAAEITPWLARVPGNVQGRPIPWFGADGLGPMDSDLAAFLKLDNQSACVVSHVQDGSPAAAAGLKEKDIIVALDGKALPRLQPNRMVAAWVERAIDGRKPGEKLPVTVIRGSDRVELTVTLGDQPKLAREADRHYFEKLGFTAREFVFGDGIQRRVKGTVRGGVVAHYVKGSGPASSGGLQPDDWIQEIDGTEVKTYADAVIAFTAIEGDSARTEFVLTVSRDGSTQVLHVKLR